MHMVLTNPGYDFTAGQSAMPWSLSAIVGAIIPLSSVHQFEGTSLFLQSETIFFELR